MSQLNRRDALRTLLYERGEKLIIVTGLGSTAYDLASCGNEPLDFPLWGAMGGARHRACAARIYRDGLDWRWRNAHGSE